MIIKDVLNGKGTGQAKSKARKFRVLAGMNYNGKRVEPGDEVDDLPEQSVKWLLKRGAIEEVEK